MRSGGDPKSERLLTNFLAPSRGISEREKNSERADNWKRELSSMTNHLECTQRKAISARPRRHPNGWTSERRARQSALVRGWQPWRRSSGPKTDAGKARCAMNALKHGHRSRATIEEFQRVRYAIRLAARNNEIMRLFIRVRDARPDLKPAYARLLLAATASLKHFRETGPYGKIQKTNDRTNESGNRPTEPIAYGRASEHPHGYARSRATSLSGLERGSVLWPSNGVGHASEIA